MSKKRNKRNTKKFRKKVKIRNQNIKRKQPIQPSYSLNRVDRKITKFINNFLEMENLIDVKPYWDEWEKMWESKEDKYGVPIEQFQKYSHHMDDWIDELLSKKDRIITLWRELLLCDKECEKVMGEGIRKTLREYFESKIYRPWFYVGNKHHKKFNEYYDFISELSSREFLESMGVKTLTNDVKDTFIYRLMDEDEYEDLIENGTIKNPSWTRDFLTINNIFKNIHPLINPKKKSVCVMGLVSKYDIITEKNSGEKRNDGTRKESEMVIRKGSKIENVKKLFDYGIDDVIEEYGEEIMEILPINPLHLSNGFTWMRVIKKYVEGQENKVSKLYQQRMISGWYYGLKDYSKLNHISSSDMSYIKNQMEELEEGLEKIGEKKLVLEEV